MKINRFIPFILLLIVVLFSLSKTLQYYFYTDDYAFLYYLRNNLDFGWPYNHVLTIFRPVFNLFQINPLPYFSLAVFTYFLASIAVYFFIKTLTGNKLIALLSSLIFATGYIGIDNFTMIAVSIINNLNIINICVTLITLTCWIKTKKLRYYLLTLLIFWLSVSIFPHRAFPLILFIPTLELLMGFQFANLKKMIRQLAFFAVRYIPFVVIASQYGIFAYANNPAHHLSRLSQVDSNRILSLLNIDFFKELFAILGRYVLSKPISDIFKFAPDQVFYSYTGLVFFGVVTIISFCFLFSKNSKYGRSLLVALFLAMEGYIAYMFLAVGFDANGPFNRYLTTSFLFFSAVLPLLFFLLLEKIGKFKSVNKRWMLVAVIVPVVVLYSLISRNYEDGIIENRSMPSKSFFKQLKTYVPALSDSNYNIFYFDNALYYPVSSRFGTVLLGAAMGKDVNIATPYKISIDSIEIVDTFEIFLRSFKNHPLGKKVFYYAFYVDENGLHNTTDKLFDLLKQGSHTLIQKEQINYATDKGSAVINTPVRNVSSLTPILAKFDLMATPFDSNFFMFPYIGSATTNDIEIRSIQDYYQKNNIQKDKIFDYLISRENYYNTVKVDVESIHIGKQNPASYLIDNNPNTFWISDQSRWEVRIKPWILIDLGQEESIGRIVWREIPGRTIRDFTISRSLDGKVWEKINNINQSKLASDPTFMINNFDPVGAHYIKIAIDGVVGPGPALAEIEVVENEFSKLDLNTAMRIKENPFEYIKDEADLMQTYNYLSQNTQLEIVAKANKDDPASNTVLLKLPIILDGYSHPYEFQIPAGGTELKSIDFKTNFPVKLTIDNFVLENIKGSVLDQQIKQKCQDFADEKDYANPFNCK